MRLRTTFFILFWFLFSCKPESEIEEKPAEIPQEKATIVEERPVEEPQKEPIKKDTISIVAVGDIMIGSTYPYKYLPKNDGADSFSEVEKYLKGDVIFGNLEGVLLDKGESYKCQDKELSRCYAFRMPERYGKLLKDAGFNLMSVANNHSNDFGLVGRKSTAQVLDTQGIFYAGYKNSPSKIFEIDGVKYGFCAFAPNRNMASLLNIPEARRIVENLKSETDIVIVSFHGGAEGVEYTRVPKTSEIFYGENRGNVYKFAHSVIDAGADIVLGHGPHITRAVELYKGKFIAYSLGNFNTYGHISIVGKSGVAPLLDIKLNKNGDFLYADVVSTKQNKIDGLQIDEEHKAFAEIERLTKLDFPQTNLNFNQKGKIHRK